MTTARSHSAWWPGLVLLAAACSSPVAAQSITISIGDASVIEGDTSSEGVVLRFPLTLSDVATNDVTVRYTTSNGTALAGTDFVFVSNAQVVIPAGTTEGFADVQIIEDLNVEPDETLTVTLGSPVNATIADGSALGTILNDEDNITISIGDASVIEGDPSESVVLRFPLTLSGLPTKPVTVSHTTSSGTASSVSDFVFTNAQVVIPAGITSGFADVEIIEDLNVEPDETLTVTLGSPANVIIADGSALGTILNDEDNITISIGDASVIEGDPSESVVLRFPLTLSGLPTKPVTVSHTTSSGTASSVSDFVFTNAQVVIPAGITSGFADVEIIEDLNVEPDETLTVTLGSPANVIIADGSALGTILNDEDNIAISIGDASVIEGDPSESVVLRFPLTLSGLPTKPVTVSHTTSSGTASSVSDFVFTNAQVVIPAGITSGFADVEIIEDLNVEPDETLTVTLGSPANVIIADGSALGTILNDEDNITISIGDASVIEGDPSESVVLRFPLTLSGLPTKPVTVSHTTSSGTASSVSDFVFTNAQVVIPAGITSGFADVEIIEDLNVEPDETLTVTLGSPANVIIADGSALGTILNDDEAVDVSPAVDPAPTELAFAGVAPNPLVSGGAVRFSLPVEAAVRLDVFDFCGRRVSRLCDGVFAAGAHTVAWSGASSGGGRLASGVYVVRFEALGRVFESRAVVIR